MPFPTFPYTPGFVHGEETSFKVLVKKFDDETEQRYLQSRQRGLGLSYHWTKPDSALVLSITSFFQTYFAQAFEVVDHRTGVTHLARFAEGTFQHLRGVAQTRDLTVRFVTTQETGTDPVAIAFTPTAQPTCFVLSFIAANTPTGTTDPFTTGFPAGTIVMSGNSIPGPLGADFAFWRLGSHMAVNSGGWYCAGAIGQLATGVVNPSNNLIHCVPFICERSGATIDAMGLFVNAAANAGSVAKLAIYEARSADNFDFVPGSLAISPCTVALDTVGLQTCSTTYTFRDDRLYYFTYVASHGGGVTLRGPTLRQVLCLDSGLDATHLFTASYAASNAYPVIFPTSVTISNGNLPGILVRFSR